MKEPNWIRHDVVRAIHARQISEHGGIDGLRDAGLLSSALDRARQRYSLADPKPDLAELAAAYALGIAKNHPFRDGNKRVALVASQLFLELNGARLAVTQEEKYQMFLDLAAGKVTEDELAEWMRSGLE